MATDCEIFMKYIENKVQAVSAAKKTTDRGYIAIYLENLYKLL